MNLRLTSISGWCMTSVALLVQARWKDVTKSPTGAMSPLFRYFHVLKYDQNVYLVKLQNGDGGMSLENIGRVDNTALTEVPASLSEETCFSSSSNEITCSG